MKSHFALALILAGSLIVGCDKQQPPTAASAPAAPEQNATNAAPASPAPAKSATSTGNPITAPVDYLGAVVNAKQIAIKKIDLAEVQRAIQSFNAQEERNPKDLQELVTMHYLGTVPPAPNGMKLDYDPATGTVRMVKQ
jgi:hypothetical protein